MKRLLLPLALTIALVLVLAGGASGDNQGADNLVAGTGTVLGFGDPMVHVNAQSGAGGVNPRGHFWIRYPNGGGEFGGSIVCLNVVANQAGLTGHIERVKVARPSFTMGNYLTIRVTDNGSPGTADLVNFDPGVPTQPACSNPTGDLMISQGNYVVHDEPVLDLTALNLQIAEFEAAAGDPYGG